MTKHTAPLDVAIVGGTRYFGARLVGRLLASGHRVTVITRGRSADPHGPAVRRLTADANDAAALTDAVAGAHFDAVVHQMIYSPVSAAAAALAFQDRTDNLIMTSTIEVYAGAPAPAGGWAEEDIDPRSQAFDATLPWLDPDFADANYGQGKREAEAALAHAAQLPTTIVRVAHVLAHDDFTRRLAWFTDRVRRGSAIADGAPSSFVHADDIAAMLAWLVEHPQEGVLNAASQPPLTPRELAAGLGAVDPPGHPVEEPELSPFHYEQPFTMSTDRVTEAGFAFRPSPVWLSELAVRDV